MDTHGYTYKPDYRPAIHPSGMVVDLPTGLTRVACTCGSRFAIPAQEESQRIFPGRNTLFVVQRTCT
jgi:hypothetical protein